MFGGVTYMQKKKNKSLQMFVGVNLHAQMYQYL